MMTIEDLRAMLPSDALEKATEMFPYTKCNWRRGINPDASIDGDEACPACLIAMAAGGFSVGYLDFEASDAIRRIVGRPGERWLYGDAISTLTYSHAGSFAEAINHLRELGL
jgi:hypothetical protein